MQASWKKNIFLISCILVFAVISLSIYLAVPFAASRLDPDSKGYDAIAVQFAAQNILTDPIDAQSAPIQPVGYPLFVGMIYKIFAHDYSYVVLIQLLFMLAIGILLYIIANQLFMYPIGEIVAFLAAVNLGFLIYPQFLLAEVLCLFFVLAFFWRLLTFIGTQQISCLIQAGFLLSISVLIKPFALLYIFVVVALLWFYIKKPVVIKLWLIGALLISFYLPIFAYMYRNQQMYGVFAFAPMTELNIYQCFLSKVIAQADNVPVQELVLNKLAFTGAHTFDSSGWDTQRLLFFAYLKKYPWLFVKVWFTNVSKTFFGLFSTQLKRLLDSNLTPDIHSFFNGHESFYNRITHYIFGGTDIWQVQFVALLEAIFNIIRLFFIAIGFYMLYAQHALFLSALFGSFILQSAFITGMDGCCRYRVMFEPFLIILTALGIYSTYRALKQKKVPVLVKKDFVL